MAEERGLIPETVDEEAACVPEIAETVDEEAAPEIPETVDEERIFGLKSSRTEDEQPVSVRNRSHGGNIGRLELLPFLAAALVLLAVTQLLAGLLWSGQRKRQEELHRTYGAEYVQE